MQRQEAYLGNSKQLSPDFKVRNDSGEIVIRV